MVEIFMGNSNKKLTDLSDLNDFVEELNAYFQNLYSGDAMDPPQPPEFNAETLGKLLDAAYDEELKKEEGRLVPIVDQAKIGYAILNIKDADEGPHI